MVLHQPVKKLVFNVRTAYRWEAEKLAYLLAVMGKERISVIHVNDSFGEDVAQGSQIILSFDVEEHYRIEAAAGLEDVGGLKTSGLDC